MHLEAVTDRRIPNLLIQVPPGCGKSTIVSVLWPAWVWLNRPSSRFVTASYSLGLAIRDAVRSREVIESPWYRERWGDSFTLSSDQNVKGRYVNDHTGFRMTTSIGSGATGERADYTLIDDPHNVYEAESLVAREQAIRWHNQSFFNRINDAKVGGRVIIGQRVHTADLIGTLKDSPDWEVLDIPEEYIPGGKPTSIGWTDPRTEEGQLLRPERFGPEQIAQAIRNLGEAGYAAQHQQRPTPKGGAAFKESWLRYWHRRGDYYILGDRAPLHLSSFVRFATVDLATSIKQTADWTVIATWDWLRTEGLLILVDLHRERMESPATIEALVSGWRRHGWRWATIEATGMQLSTVQHARARGLPVQQCNPHKDKYTRSLAAQVKASEGKIWLPASAHWLPAYKGELLAFPLAAHDDQVDVTSTAAEIADSMTRQGRTAPPLTNEGMTV